MLKMKPCKWLVIQMAAGMVMIGLLAGCASNHKARGNFGILNLSREVSRIFESYKVLPEYNYYFSGSVTKPRAIMGIDRNYTLATGLWKEAVDLTPEQLKKWVDQILGFLPPTRTFGAYILDPNGQQVGIWYSPRNDSSVTVQPDNRIEIIPP